MNIIQYISKFYEERFSALNQIVQRENFKDTKSYISTISASVPLAVSGAYRVRLENVITYRIQSRTRKRDASDQAAVTDCTTLFGKLITSLLQLRFFDYKLNFR